MVNLLDDDKPSLTKKKLVKLATNTNLLKDAGRFGLPDKKVAVLRKEKTDPWLNHAKHFHQKFHVPKIEESWTLFSG